MNTKIWVQEIWKKNQSQARFFTGLLEEGEVVIGQKTNSTGSETNRKDSQQKVGSLWGIPLVSGDAGGKNTSSSTTTENLKEWQITYECHKSKTTKL